MHRNEHRATPAGEPIARLAVAQFLLLEATVESLSVLGERLSSATRDAQSLTTREAMVEPFRTRYVLLRAMLRQPSRH